MSEGEADTTEGAGEVETMPTPTAEGPEGSGAEIGPVGAAASRGDTLDTTAVEADAEGEGGRHGEEKRERETVAGRRENPAGKSSGVGVREGTPEASRVAKTPGGDRQGVGGGVELPRGTNTPGVEELPWGNQTSGVTLEGDKVPGEDGQGQG